MEGGEEFLFSAFQKNFHRLFDRIKQVLNEVCLQKKNHFESKYQSVCVIYRFSF